MAAGLLVIYGQQAMKEVESYPLQKSARFSRQPGDPEGTHGFASHPCGWFALVEEFR